MTKLDLIIGEAYKANVVQNQPYTIALRHFKAEIAEDEAAAKEEKRAPVFLNDAKSKLEQAKRTLAADRICVITGLTYKFLSEAIERAEKDHAA